MSVFIRIILLRTVGSPKAGKKNSPLVEMFGPSERKRVPSVFSIF